MPAVRILVVSDRPLIAEALAALLSVDPRVGVVDAAQLSGEEYVSRAFDVVIADLDTFNARVLLGRLRQDCAFVHLSRRAPTMPLHRKTGPTVSLPSDTSSEALIAAACTLAHDPQSAPAKVADKARGSRDKPLSAREIEIVRLVAAGHTQSSIAAALGIGTKSVQSYRARAADKLMLRTRVDLVCYARQQGWLD